MALDILLDPNGFLRRRADDPSMLGPVVLVALVGILSASSSFLLVQKVAGSLDSSVGSIVAVSGAIGSLIALFVVFVLWVVYAGAFHVISLVFDGEGDFRTTLALVGWGYVPAVFSALVSVALTYLVLQQVAAPTDAASAATFQRQLQSNPLIVTSSVVGIVFTLWQGFIWTFAVRHARGLELREAALTVAGPVGLSVLAAGYNLL